MGQSIGSVGNSHHRKARGADNQQKNQPSANPGQRLSDQQPPKPEKGTPKAASSRAPAPSDRVGGALPMRLRGLNN